MAREEKGEVGRGKKPRPIALAPSMPRAPVGAEAVVECKAVALETLGWMEPRQPAGRGGGRQP